MNISWTKQNYFRVGGEKKFPMVAILLGAVLSLVMLSAPLSNAFAVGTAPDGSKVMVLEKFKYKDYQAYIAENSKDTLLVIGFFASWCPYCAEEFPVFAQENVKLNKNGQCVSFLGANMQDSYKPALGFITKAGTNFDTVMLDKQTVAKLFIRGVPTTLFYRDGKLVDMIAGTVDLKSLKQHVKAYGGPNC